ncbi:carboxypeptidase-like regulatory domain-containing protein [Anabaena sp. PCC 7108]|uniref:carboxypeptidase-like regulatory domain-containing protein n=1 Tax=Anabaena sp. PCC 7108 TaxID=163908 RepID=UPI000380A215|nr:carboxypeptidase-like regulatory domain-containing protein [Anabaena sp. PCC 7108]
MSEFKFTGMVVNQKNTPIEGAKVSLQYSDIPMTEHTDTDGNFRFTIRQDTKKVDPEIRIEADGYGTYERKIEISPERSSMERIVLTQKNNNPISNEIKVAIIAATGVIIAALVTGYFTLIKPPDKPLPSSPTNQPSSQNPSPSPTSTNVELRLLGNSFNGYQTFQSSEFQNALKKKV